MNSKVMFEIGYFDVGQLGHLLTKYGSLALCDWSVTGIVVEGWERSLIALFSSLRLKYLHKTCILLNSEILNHNTYYIFNPPITHFFPCILPTLQGNVESL